MAEREQVKGVSPSKFMRELRPEFYSDTSDRTAYQLDASALEYHLDSITSRNQTHDFEIFCRKLCERTICPNLKPATGPEGGGDSKADSETIPIADEIATLTYMGTQMLHRSVGHSLSVLRESGRRKFAMTLQALWLRSVAIRKFIV